MVIWLRLATVWLLALALPLQGYAAAAMRHCEPAASVSLTEAMSARPAGDAVASHEHANPARAPHHHASLHHASHDAAPHDHAAHDHSTRGHSGHDHAKNDQGPGDPVAAHADHATHKCSACGSCCAAALPSIAPLVPTPAGLAAWQPLPLQGRVAHVTSGPERPPRSFLA